MIISLASDASFQFLHLSEEARTFVSFDHLFMSKYGCLTKYFASSPRICFFSYNPPPGSHERNTKVNSTDVEKINEAVAYGNFDYNTANDAFLRTESYFDELAVHSHFLNIEQLLVEFDGKFDGSGKICPIVVDIFKWATSETVASLPDRVIDEWLELNVFISDVVRYKPDIIFLGLELSRCLQLIPGLHFQELFSSSKKVETNSAFFAWKRIKHVGKVLFVQAHSTPGPFGKFNTAERREIGNKLKNIYFDNKNK